LTLVTKAGMTGTNENLVLEMFEYFKIYFFMYSIANVMQFRAK